MDDSYAQCRGANATPLFCYNVAMMKPRLFTLLLAMFVIGCTAQQETKQEPTTTKHPLIYDDTPFVVAVMDPLAVDLACACIPGFAQRQYRALSPVLAEALGRPVELQFSASLENHLTRSPTGRVDLVVGKVSVVQADAAKLQVSLGFLGHLTDPNGKTTHHAVFVVPSDDEEAQTIADLESYTIFFGSPDAEEKYAVAVATLATYGIAVPESPPTFMMPIDAVFELYNVEKSAAVIARYEKILLEGCGTIEKGGLRIVGTTAEVPFVAFYAPVSTNQQDIDNIKSALAKIKDDENLRRSLETTGVQFSIGSNVEAVKKKKEPIGHWIGHSGEDRIAVR